MYSDRRAAEYDDWWLGRGLYDDRDRPGWDEELDRPVAIKVLAEHLAGDPEFRARFLREARIASRLQHPNLVRVFDIAETDELPSIVMELVNGPTLDGGRLMFLGYEAVTRRRANARIEAHIHAIGLVMMLGLAFYVTVFKDFGFGSK